jgi:hypothetical protein
VQDVRSNYVTFSRHHSRQGLKGTAEVSISWLAGDACFAE